MNTESASDTAEAESSAQEGIVDSRHVSSDRPHMFERLARKQDQGIFRFSTKLVGLQFLLMVCVTPVATIIDRLCRSQGIDHNVNPFTVLSDAGPLKTFLIVGIIGPLIETLVFQVALIELVRLLSPQRLWVQLAISAIVFSVMHFWNSVMAGILAGGVGGVVLALAYLVGRQRSFGRAFVGPLLTHVMWNCMLTTVALMAENQSS